MVGKTIQVALWPREGEHSMRRAVGKIIGNSGDRGTARKLKARWGDGETLSGRIKEPGKVQGPGKIKDTGQVGKHLPAR